MRPIALSTLGDLSACYRLHGVYNACHGMRALSLELLLGRVGPDFPIGREMARLRCRECFSRDCGIRIVWAGNVAPGVALAG